MRNRWDATRLLAADKARASGSEDEAKRIMQFQFHAIRPKAASEIADISEARASWALKRRDYCWLFADTAHFRIGERAPDRDWVSYLQAV